MISVVQDSVGVEKQRGYTFLPKIERNLIELSISHVWPHDDEGSGKRSLASRPIRLHLYFDQSFIWNDTVSVLKKKKKNPNILVTVMHNDTVFLCVERHRFLFIFLKYFLDRFGCTSFLHKRSLSKIVFGFAYNVIYGETRRQEGKNVYMEKQDGKQHFKA